jgi:hypothetical protein
VKVVGAAGGCADIVLLERLCDVIALRGKP